MHFPMLKQLRKGLFQFLFGQLRTVDGQSDDPLFHFFLHGESLLSYVCGEKQEC